VKILQNHLENQQFLLQKPTWVVVIQAGVFGIRMVSFISIPILEIPVVEADISASVVTIMEVDLTVVVVVGNRIILERVEDMVSFDHLSPLARAHLLLVVQRFSFGSLVLSCWSMVPLMYLASACLLDFQLAQLVEVLVAVHF
jgi:hypothetical protein